MSISRVGILFLEKIWPINSCFIVKMMIIISIVVSYNPDIETLRFCINSLFFQCDEVFVVDNGTSYINEIDFDVYENVRLISLGDNFGVALAHNVGIQRALGEGADYILLSDQDTAYPKNYVADMLASLEKLDGSARLAVMCPNFYEANRAELCPMIFDDASRGFKPMAAVSGLYKVAFANASGMLIPARVFADVGFMREDLFIDCVDTEWCIRARHHGYSIYCNADMVITHSLGDRSVNILGRLITLHSPLRHYYQARNNVYLALYSRHLTLNKRFYFLFRAIMRVVGHAALSAPRHERLAKGLRGIWHGLTGRLGKYA